MKNEVKCLDESCTGTLYPANVSINLNESLRMDYAGVLYCICCGSVLIDGKMIGPKEIGNYLVREQFKKLGIDKFGKLELNALSISVKSIG